MDLFQLNLSVLVKKVSRYYGKRSIAAFPLINVEVFLEDGKYHDVDSSDMAFRIASRQAMRQAIGKANAKFLEPVMKVEVTTPDEYQGSVIGDLSSRRGMIQGSETDPKSIIHGEVIIAERFTFH